MDDHTTIQEVASHLEDSAPLLFEFEFLNSEKFTSYSRAFSPKHPEPPDPNSMLFAMVDWYRAAFAWQWIIGPSLLLYTLCMVSVGETIRIE